jgi:hypothetical protein
VFVARHPTIYELMREPGDIRGERMAIAPVPIRSAIVRTVWLVDGKRTVRNESKHAILASVFCSEFVTLRA